ncbi:MAG: class I SAM-dependent methyltransferase [Candidatus Woesearchaeota archaeon]
MRAKQWDKIAPDYYQYIVSPFNKGVKNPIFRLMKKIKRRRTVLEVGCGTGTLIPFLAKNFEQVTAIDFSKKMIDIAEAKYGKLGNVEFVRMDALNISRLHKKFDLVVSVNSVLMPDIIKVNKILKRMHHVLAPRGHLVGIFPAMDALVFEAMVTYDSEYEKQRDRAKARRATNKVIDRRFHDFCYGYLYASKPEETQKHFFGFELMYRLKKAGFRDVKMFKVLYPWEKPTKLHDKVWDWGVSARA